MRIRVPQQPLQLLLMLVERPGAVVSREELQKRLWPSEVFVDFDHGLNKNIQKLREALGDSADSPVYVETIPRIGYRFIGTIATPPKPPVGLPPQPLPPLPQHSEPPPAPAPRRRTGRHRWLWPVLAVAGVCLVAAPWLLWRRMQTPAIHSLAVLPLRNLSGDPGKDYFAEGITDELITELAHIPNLRVVSRTSVMQDQWNKKPMREIARELGVDAVVEGSVALQGDRVRITAQLIDARQDRHLWAQTFEDTQSDVLALQDSVAREIATQTRVALSPPQTGSRKPLNPQAEDAYLRGLYFLNRREVVKSGDYFQQAVSIDPSYAAAYAGLALALQAQHLISWSNLPMGELLPKALAAAKRSVALDPGSGEAYTALGGLEMNNWEWLAAERDLQRAIALSPSYSLAEMNYAIYLDTTNRPREAVRHMQRALQLDPMSFFMTRQMGTVLYFARRYDDSLLYLQRANEMEPGAAYLVQNWMSRVYEARGMQQDAVTADLKALKAGDERALYGEDSLSAVYRRSGWKAYQRARAAALARAGNDTCSSYEVAVSYLRAGDHDQAFAWLDRSANKECFYTQWAQVEPLLDGVRSDPRYLSLIKKMNLAY